MGFFGGEGKGNGEREGRVSQRGERDTDEITDEERFAGLDESLWQVVKEMDRDLEVWWDENGRRCTDREELEFLRGRIRELETWQLRDLIEWIYGEGHEDELEGYQWQMFYVWGEREGKVGREFLRDLMVRHGLTTLKEEDELIMGNVLREEIQECYLFLMAGAALTNPKWAWEQYLVDRDEVVLKVGDDGGVMCWNYDSGAVHRIFKGYAAKFPEEAWEKIRQSEDAELLHGMYEGYVLGVPEGQDWKALAESFSEKWTGLGEESGQWIMQEAVQRWVMEDYEKALQWYVEVGKINVRWFNRVFSESEEDDMDPFAEPEFLEEPPLNGFARGVVLATQFYDEMYRSNHDLQREVVASLGDLLEHDEESVVATVLSGLARSGLGAEDLPLVRLVERFEDREMGEEVLLSLVESVPVRGEIYLFMDIDEPNDFLEDMRSTVAEMELTAETRRKVEAKFREVEEEEARNWREMEERRSEGDPFAEGGF